MKARLGKLLRRLLPPPVYKRAITFWRHRLYWQQKVHSTFVRRCPIAQAFSTERRSALAEQIRDVNVLAPTGMCHAMHWHGSDKSLYRHNYTTIYNGLLAKSRRLPLHIFELGLGSKNSQFAFNMWAHGVPGASLRAWRDLFPNARVFGADIDRESLFEEDRIQTCYCDQLDVSAIKEMWSHPGFDGGMDVIIDDGLHTFEGNSVFLCESLDHLLPGGIYVVEDISSKVLDKWREWLRSEVPKRFRDYDFVLAQLPNPYNEVDNNLLVIRRDLTRSQANQASTPVVTSES